MHVQCTQRHPRLGHKAPARQVGLGTFVVSTSSGIGRSKLGFAQSGTTEGARKQYLTGGLPDHTHPGTLPHLSVQNWPPD